MIEPGSLSRLPVMSDSELRDLERRAAQGERPAEAKLLLERVRRGELGQDQLQLAAYLEHPAARLALEGDELQAGAAKGGGWVKNLLRRRRDDASQLAEWAQGLAPWGQRLVVRGLLAATRLALPIFAAERDDLAPSAALEAVASWGACPCRPCAEKAEGLATSALEQAQKLEGQGAGAAAAAFHAARATHHLAVIAFECGTLPKPDAAQRLHFLTPALLTELTGAGLTADAIRGAIRDELLPLALQLSTAGDAAHEQRGA